MSAVRRRKISAKYRKIVGRSWGTGIELEFCLIAHQSQCQPPREFGVLRRRGMTDKDTLGCVCHARGALFAFQLPVAEAEFFQGRPGFLDPFFGNACCRGRLEGHLQLEAGVRGVLREHLRIEIHLKFRWNFPGPRQLAEKIDLPGGGRIVINRQWSGHRAENSAGSRRGTGSGRREHQRRATGDCRLYHFTIRHRSLAREDANVLRISTSSELSGVSKLNGS